MTGPMHIGFIPTVGPYLLPKILPQLKEEFPELELFLHEAQTHQLVRQLEEGKLDCLVLASVAKPFAPEVLLNMVSRYAPIKSDDNGDAVVADEKSLRLLALADKVARTDANVMILGPSGSGKEVMSRYIHKASNRKDGPFVAINCAAIPDNMLEATLFGYEKGAFTGA
ncbi:two-component response regulator, partial [Vibrio parahaemolyticus AQ3810]